MEHFLPYEEIKSDNISELVDKIKLKNKKSIKDLKLIDLIFEKKSMNGVYLIFDKENKNVYIGKTVSRAILERIAAHLDMRENAFMNNFLCGLTGKFKGRKTIQPTEKEIFNAYDSAIEHKILFIEVNGKELISRLERILISEFKPSLNKILNTKIYDKNTKINNLIV